MGCWQGRAGKASTASPEKRAKCAAYPFTVPHVNPHSHCSTGEGDKRNKALPAQALVLVGRGPVSAEREGSKPFAGTAPRIGAGNWRLQRSDKTERSWRESMQKRSYCWWSRESARGCCVRWGLCYAL